MAVLAGQDILLSLLYFFTYLPNTPATFSDKNKITINADINKELNTTLLIINSINIAITEDPPSPVANVGTVILNITRPTPINKIEITHKYGIKFFFKGLPNMNN
jgi:hypothetical protein